MPERLDVVDSTNRYLVDLAKAGVPGGLEIPEGYAVVAESQSAGRGRRDRTWEAPAGSAVLCSILFRPDLGPDELHLVTWAVALAAVQACRITSGVDLSLKWPNDLIALEEPLGDAPGSGARSRDAERKVAGILAEALTHRGDEDSGETTGKPAGIVVGIGINVNWPPDWPPVGSTDPALADIAARATSLDRLAGHPVDKRELVDHFLRGAGRWNEMLASSRGRRSVVNDYRLACATIGQEVRVELENETVAGVALDVDNAGHLLVSTETGPRTIAAGDVVHVR
ncbi:MAG: biotin--[acetyl-CoA-carboxylase] ligase [Acidimicrobiales bacterium]